jgi:hypothetical protein
MSFAEAMESVAVFNVPLTLPSPPFGGEDKGEGV